MEENIVILNGSCEHPCWREDDNSCSAGCPNLCNNEGFSYSEGVVLGKSNKKEDYSCRIKCEGSKMKWTKEEPQKGIVKSQLQGKCYIRSEERRVGKECRSRWS